MGGMTIMSLAEQRPDLFGDRIVGAVLIGTSASNMADAVVRLPVRVTGMLTGRVLPRLNQLAGRNAGVIERTRRVGSDFGFVLTKAWGFGDDPSPAQVEFVERMVAATPIDVITSFTSTFTERDRYEALQHLGQVPTLVLVGDRDRITPLRESKTLAQRLSGSELVVLTGAGHMVMAERAPLVNLHLRAFLRRMARTSRAQRGA
jgi:pimeloyl-ACP methyl ester carboxylesterase